MNPYIDPDHTCKIKLPGDTKPCGADGTIRVTIRAPKSVDGVLWQGQTITTDVCELHGPLFTDDDMKVSI